MNAFSWMQIMAILFMVLTYIITWNIASRERAGLICIGFLCAWIPLCLAVVFFKCTP